MRACPPVFAPEAERLVRESRTRGQGERERERDLRAHRWPSIAIRRFVWDISARSYLFASRVASCRASPRRTRSQVERAVIRRNTGHLSKHYKFATVIYIYMYVRYLSEENKMFFAIYTIRKSTSVTILPWH